MAIQIPNIIKDITYIRSNRWLMKRDLRLKELLLYLANDEKESIRKFKLIWRVKDTDSVVNAKRVDLLDEFDQYSEQEKRSLLENLLALELTTGCNGGCYYCVSGQKFKIYEKYTFLSIKSFYEKYKSYFDNEIKPLIYWDSDAFIYEDKEGDKVYNLKDIYDLFFSDGQDAFVPYISSTIPAGSQYKFIKFVYHIYTEYYFKKRTIPKVRISLGKHNVLRVESVMIYLWKWMKKKGVNNSEIFIYFNKLFTFDIRDNQTVMNVGPLIKLGDKYRDIISPNTDEGFILSPNSDRMLSMASASQHHPLGARIVKIGPGNVIKNLVKRDTLYKYTYFFYDTYYKRKKGDFENQLKEIFENDSVFLTIIDSGEPFYNLSRWALSFRHFLLFTSQLDTISDFYFDRFLKQAYLEFKNNKRDLIRNWKISLSKFSTEEDYFRKKTQKEDLKLFLFQYTLISLFFMSYSTGGHRRSLLKKIDLLLSYSKKDEFKVLFLGKYLLYR